MYPFLIVINIGPCHRNPRLLPTLVPYVVMCRHSQKEILDVWYFKEKWTMGVEKTMFEMYPFFNIINIGPCQRNPRLLPILVPYWMMCRYPKRKSQMGGM